MEQIKLAADDLGDPTDTETGWDVHFRRVKTGPNVYNVDYQLQALKCKPRALTSTEQALVADLRSMDEILPRPTADQQKTFLEGVAGSEGVPSEVSKELEAEDLPY